MATLLIIDNQRHKMADILNDLLAEARSMARGIPWGMNGPGEVHRSKRGTISR